MPEEGELEGGCDFYEKDVIIYRLKNAVYRGHHDFNTGSVLKLLLMFVGDSWHINVAAREDKFIFGLHQRRDNHIFSPIPLEEYDEIETDDTDFFYRYLYQGDLHCVYLRNRVMFLRYISYTRTCPELLPSF